MVQNAIRYVLAKIQMVTKHGQIVAQYKKGYVLAKIQMVTKLLFILTVGNEGYVLAKIQMVTKLDTLHEDC